MGIYISLNPRQFANPRSQIKGRIAFGMNALKNLESAFFPSALSIWKNSAFHIKDESLEIRPRIELPQPVSYMDIWERLENFSSEATLEDQISSVIKIEGKWDLHSKELLGYVSINNNPVWRRTYADIEIEGYPKGEVNDIVDLFWTNNTLRNALVTRFMKEMSSLRDAGMELTGIVYSVGVPSGAQDIASTRASYYHTRRAFVKDLLTTYLAEMKENKNKSILSRMKPYNVDFLITRLMSDDNFNQDLSEIENEAGLIEVEAHSIAFVGEDKDSIQKTYKLLSRKVFDAMASALPRDKEINDRIAEALVPEGQTKMDGKNRSGKKSDSERKLDDDY